MSNYLEIQTFIKQLTDYQYAIHSLEQIAENIKQEGYTEYNKGKLQSTVESYSLVTKIDLNSRIPSMEDFSSDEDYALEGLFDKIKEMKNNAVKGLDTLKSKMNVVYHKFTEDAKGLNEDIDTLISKVNSLSKTSSSEKINIGNSTATNLSQGGKFEPIEGLTYLHRLLSQKETPGYNAYLAPVLDQLASEVSMVKDKSTQDAFINKVVKSKRLDLNTVYKGYQSATGIKMLEDPRPRWATKDRFLWSTDTHGILGNNNAVYFLGYTEDSKTVFTFDQQIENDKSIKGVEKNQPCLSKSQLLNTLKQLKGFNEILINKVGDKVEKELEIGSRRIETMANFVQDLTMKNSKETRIMYRYSSLNTDAEAIAMFAYHYAWHPAHTIQFYISLSEQYKKSVVALFEYCQLSYNELK